MPWLAFRNRPSGSTISAMITSLLTDLPAISVVEQHAALGSTNDRARELARQDTPQIAVIAADEQLAGRGRQGRSWYTPPGTALAFSLLTRPAIASHQAMRLTMLAGLAVVEGIEWATDLRLALKWPNDIVFENEGRLRKVGGILTECAFQGDTVEYAIVGIGLNVNVDFSQQLELREIATSLMRLAGHDLDRWAVLKAVVAAFIDRYAEIAEADHLREAWAARMINLRRNIRVNLNNQIVEGYAEGVDDDGALRLRTADGRVQRLLSGDVTLHNL
jgi:BirA family transcriptional regulator, biotin operon repressor / biotin---[acetyl-CoA-carboxylase] ligase